MTVGRPRHLHALVHGAPYTLQLATVPSVKRSWEGEGLMARSNRSCAACADARDWGGGKRRACLEAFPSPVVFW